MICRPGAQCSGLFLYLYEGALQHGSSEHEHHTLLPKMGTKPSPVQGHPWGAMVFYLYELEGHRLEFWESVR